MPAIYMTMDRDVSLPNDEVLHIPAPRTSSHLCPISRSVTSIIEECWPEQVRTLLSKHSLEAREWISWATYYASITEPPATPPTKAYILPLFTESPNFPVMVWHQIKVLCQVISYINPGQTPGMVANQLLFPLAKKHQSQFPQTEHGDDSYLVILQVMHTVKVRWSVSGNWLDSSGWTTALTNNGISTSGKI